MAAAVVEIKRLETARDTLEDLYGGPEPETIKVKPGRYVRRGVALYNASVMPEPLRAIELAAAAGITKAAASKYLKRWAADRWVRKVKHGRYVRTAKFPATVIPAE
jgi:hypothetical protein